MKSLASGVAMIFVFCVISVSVADALVFEGLPTEGVVFKAPESESVMAALKYELSGMREGEYRVITAAYVIWPLEGVAPGRTSEFRVYEATRDWSKDDVRDGTGSVIIADVAADDWDIMPLDFERNGGLVQLDITQLVEGWCANPSRNFGVVVTTEDMTPEMLRGQLGNARLIVRYGFYNRTEN